MESALAWTGRLSSEAPGVAVSQAASGRGGAGLCSAWGTCPLGQRRAGVTCASCRESPTTRAVGGAFTRSASAESGTQRYWATSAVWSDGAAGSWGEGVPQPMAANENRQATGENNERGFMVTPGPRTWGQSGSGRGVAMLGFVWIERQPFVTGATMTLICARHPGPP